MINMLPKCPGIYCGRILDLHGNYSECGPCPPGFRTPSSYVTQGSAKVTSECLPCSELLTFYDIMYLLFIIILVLIFQCYFIDYSLKRRQFTGDVLALHFSATIETVGAAIATLLVYSSPKWSFTIKTCGVYKLSDWYTLLYNPTPDYETSIRCTQEAVYPLYSMVFLFYLFVLILLIMIRPFVVRKIDDKHASKIIYLSMYLIPGLALIHAVFGGLIYYSFPYVTIIGSIVSVASHLACRLDQRMLPLVLNSFQDGKSIVILIGHWLLHSFGLIALTQLKDPILHGSLLIVVPIPTLFYILTSKFSDPSKLHLD